MSAPVPDETIVVVGAGPAGLRAVEALADVGLRPILIDEASRPGGQIFRQPPKGAERDPRRLYGFEAGKAARLHGLLEHLGGKVDYRPDTLVWSIEGRRLDLVSAGTFDQITADRLILATGAMDRVLPFPGCTLPGVFTLGAAQIALKAQGVSIGRRVALVGAGPLLPLVAAQYLKAGAYVVAVLDVTPFAPKLQNLGAFLNQPTTFAKGLWYIAQLALGGKHIRSGVKSPRALGTSRVEGLGWTDAKERDHVVACDAIGASFGLKSEAQLADLAGCRFQFDPTTRQWQPERTPDGRSSVAGVYLAGDGAAIGGADVAELQGERAALSLIGDLGLAVDPARVQSIDASLARHARFRAGLEAAYPYPGHLLDTLTEDETLCRCEGITIGQLREAGLTRGATELNRLKALTRIGMGRCQGRVCGHAAAELLARTLGVDVEAVGRLRANPPVKPIPVREGF